jgi:hypothetical protein
MKAARRRAAPGLLIGYRQPLAGALPGDSLSGYQTLSFVISSFFSKSFRVAWSQTIERAGIPAASESSISYFDQPVPKALPQ